MNCEVIKHSYRCILFWGDVLVKVRLLGEPKLPYNGEDAGADCRDEHRAWRAEAIS